MENLSVLQGTKENFDQVINGQTPALVDFWATWCGPCRMVGPIIEQLAEDYAGRLTVCKVNVDEEPQLAEQYGIVSIPAVMIFQNGEVVERFVGARPKHLFAEMIEKHL